MSGGYHGYWLGTGPGRSARTDYRRSTYSNSGSTRVGNVSEHLPESARRGRFHKLKPAPLHLERCGSKTKSKSNRRSATADGTVRANCGFSPQTAVGATIAQLVDSGTGAHGQRACSGG